MENDYQADLKRERKNKNRNKNRGRFVKNDGGSRKARNRELVPRSRILLRERAMASGRKAGRGGCGGGGWGAYEQAEWVSEAERSCREGVKW